MIQFLRQQLADKFDVTINDIQVSLPPDKSLGDIAIAPFLLAKALKIKPFDAAAKLKAELEVATTIKSVAQKGLYLNCFFTEQALLDLLLNKAGDYSAQINEDEDPVLIEFSSPNTNKPQHLGHVRNNIYGHSLVELLNSCGQKTLAVNLVNDRGTHICKSMLAYKEEAKDLTPEETGEKGDHFVGRYYIAFSKLAEEAEDYDKKAQDMLVKWEEGDSEIRLLWLKLKNFVMEGFKQTYNDYGIQFNRYDFESDLYLKGRDIVLKYLEKGIFYKKDDGAIAVDLTEQGLDEKIVLRADGTSIYITQDLGVIFKRYEDLKFSKMYYVVGSEQDYHFNVLFKIIKQIGADFSDDLKHLSYGMVYLPEGRMKSREGKVVDADDLLLETMNLVRENMGDRYSESSEEEIKELSRKIALAAIKVFLLKVTPKKDIHFNPSEAISFEGDTGPYALYTIARCKSILRKVGHLKDLKSDLSEEFHQSERSLMARMLFFEDTRLRACNQLNPSILVSYIIELAKDFNAFYRDVPVSSCDEKLLKERRVLICIRFLEVIETALSSIGVESVERM